MKSPKDVLALGQIIVRQLNLEDRGAVLERWLAHHLAELLADVDRQVGEAKRAAEQQAVDTILKLWTNRRALPQSVDPLGGFRDAISMLARLAPSANPWQRYTGDNACSEILREMFQTHCKIVMSGLLLTQGANPRPVSPAELSSLELEETSLLTELDKWAGVVSKRLSPLEVRIWLDGLCDVDNERSTGRDDDQETPERLSVPPSEQDLQLEIATHLEAMQSDLARLLTRWKETNHQRLSLRSPVVNDEADD